MPASTRLEPHHRQNQKPKSTKLSVKSPNKLSLPSRQEPLASTLRPDNTSLPITESERTLFAACFGQLIEQILAEID
jgi:hypothetical protein